LRKEFGPFTKQEHAVSVWAEITPSVFRSFARL